MSNQLLDEVRNNNILAVSNILKSGVDINYIDEKGESAIFLAIHFENYEISKLLLSYKADCTIKYEKDGYTILHAAISNGLLDICKLIIENTSNINIRDNYGNNALWTAVFEVFSNDDYLEIIELLLQKGADPYTKNKVGNILVGKKKVPLGISMSPYDAALEDNLPKVIELMQKYQPLT